MATPAILLILLLALGASADQVIWAQPDEAACAALRAESLSWGMTPGAVEESLRSDPSCQLSDAALRSHFPEIGPDSRIDECSHHTYPRSSTIRYAAYRTGEHTVATREVHCRHYPDTSRSDCEFESTKRHFLKGINDYFEVDDSFPEATAIEVAEVLPSSLTALFGATGIYRKRVDSMALRRLSAQDENVEIDLSSCGCKMTVIATRVTRNDGARLVPASEPSLVCY